jgi:hypothetical protein
LVDERACRRPKFREGTNIRLADGQTWTLPAPPKPSEWMSPPFEAVYTDLMHAIEETDDRQQRTLAALSFAIFLLGHNYCLRPEDYQQLLGFRPDSAALFEWQSALCDVTEKHLRSLADAPPIDGDCGTELGRARRFLRIRAWLQQRLPFRWRPVNPS